MPNFYPDDVLSATAAPVNGNPSPVRTWQWYRDGVPISGANTLNYVIQSEDVNTGLQIEQIETNFLGSDVAISELTDIIKPLPSALFSNGQAGVWYDPSDLSTLFQDIDGNTPVTIASQTVGRINDKSGQGNHAIQATAAARPLYQTLPHRLVLDKVDDRLITNVPVGGFVGTMIISTPEGTAAYGVNIPAGNYDIGGVGGAYFPGSAIIGYIIRNESMDNNEIENTITYLRDRKGGGLNYGSVTSFISFWRDRTELTSFPIIDSSNGTSFTATWRGCNSLTSFPFIDVSSSLNFQGTWFLCTSLVDFPANFFDGCLATNFTNAFSSTALNQTSIDNILVSIESNGTSNGTFNQSGGSAPSTLGNSAIDALRSRGWTVTVTGGY